MFKIKILLRHFKARCTVAVQHAAAGQHCGRIGQRVSNYWQRHTRASKKSVGQRDESREGRPVLRRHIRQLARCRQAAPAQRDQRLHDAGARQRGLSDPRVSQQLSYACRGAVRNSQRDVRERSASRPRGRHSQGKGGEARDRRAHHQSERSANFEGISWQL